MEPDSRDAPGIRYPFSYGSLQTAAGGLFRQDVLKGASVSEPGAVQMNGFDSANRNNEELIINAVLNATDGFALNDGTDAVPGDPAADREDSPEDSVLTVDSVLRIRSQLTGSIPVVAGTQATIRDAEPEDAVEPGKPLKNPLPQPESGLRKKLRQASMFMAEIAGDTFPETFPSGDFSSCANPEEAAGKTVPLSKEAGLKEFDLSIGENDDFDLK